MQPHLFLSKLTDQKDTSDSDSQKATPDPRLFQAGFLVPKQPSSCGAWDGRGGEGGEGEGREGVGGGGDEGRGEGERSESGLVWAPLRSPLPPIIFRQPEVVWIGGDHTVLCLSLKLPTLCMVACVLCFCFLPDQHN